MNVQIYSRKRIESLIAEGEFPQNTAVISFCSCGTRPSGRVDYRGVCDRVIYIELDDLDIEDISDSGYTYDTFFFCKLRILSEQACIP